MTADESTRFFREDYVKDAIHAIAASDKIVVFVGLGASIESSLPTWDDLVRSLMKAVVHRYGRADDPEAASRMATALVTQFGPMITAEMAADQAQSPRHAEDFRELVRKQLYAKIDDEGIVYAPGHLQNAIARLVLTSGNPSAITTNYDDLLERALVAQVDDTEDFEVAVLPIANPAELSHTEQPNELRIFHIHGYLPRDGVASQHLVLSESDYLLETEGLSWYREMLDSALGDVEGTCVFVGSSLTDPNIVRYLHRASRLQEGATIYALLPRQGEAWAAGLNQSNRTKVEEMIDQRLQGLNVEVLRPDYFSQVAQFLNEVAIWRVVLERQAEQGGPEPGRYSDWPDRYGARLDQWREEWEESWEIQAFRDGENRPTYAVGSFLDAQQRMGTDLQDALEEVNRILARKWRAKGLTESFGLHLWARDPRSQTFELWCSTATTVKDPALMVRLDVSESSKYHAVRTWCVGAPGYTDLGEESRWSNVFAWPIRLDGKWESLPVGVITLSSTAIYDKSRFKTISAKKRELAEQEIIEVGRWCLDPMPDDN